MSARPNARLAETHRSALDMTNSQTFKELLLSLIELQKSPDEDAQSLFKMIQNNICYVLEFREMVLHALVSYNENYNTK